LQVRMQHEEAARSSGLAELSAQLRDVEAQLQRCSEQAGDIAKLRNALFATQEGNMSEHPQVHNAVETFGRKMRNEVEDYINEKLVHQAEEVDQLHAGLSMLLTERAERAEGAERAEQTSPDERTVNRPTTLEDDLNGARRLAEESCAKAMRRMDHFEATTLVVDGVIDGPDADRHSVEQRRPQAATSSPGGTGPTRDSQQAMLESMYSRIGNVEAALLSETRELDGRHEHSIPASHRGNGGDRHHTAKKGAGQTDAWLQMLVTKSADAERRLQTLEKRLPKSMRDFEEPLEDALSQLTLGVLKMAQLLGVASEESCEKLAWRDACTDLPSMMDHAWLRSRLPKRASVLKILRQKADAEQLRQLQEQFDKFVGAPSRHGPQYSNHQEAELSGPGMGIGQNNNAMSGLSGGPRYGSDGNMATTSEAISDTARQNRRHAQSNAQPEQTRPLSHRGPSPVVPPSPRQKGGSPPKDVWANSGRSTYERPQTGSIIIDSPGGSMYDHVPAAPPGPPRGDPPGVRLA